MQFKQTSTGFILEIIIFLISLGLITLIPLNQILMQSSVFILSVYSVISSRFRKFSLSQLGIKRPEHNEVIGWIICTCLLLSAILLIKLFNTQGVFVGVLKSRNDFVYIIPFYILVGTFMQEFVFRSYLYARTNILYSSRVSVIINILIFSIFHLPYLVQFNSNLMYLSIGAGIVWSIAYYKYPNLFLSWLSHGFVGALALLLLQKF